MEKTQLQKATDFIREKGLLQKGDRVLVACSGGVDSMALLHYLAAMRPVFGFETAAIHVDHCLRGAESAEDGEVVQQLADRLGVRCHRTAVPVPELMETSGGNVQDVCRRGRYAKFKEVMAEGRYAVLAAAHHSEDQLETVLMQITKGQRPKGMPAVRHLGEGRLIRPFLQLGKADLYAYAADHDLAYREDPSNMKDDYTRNRYRHHVLPALLREEPAAAVQSVRMTETLQEEDDLLGGLAEEQTEKLIRHDEKGRLCIETEMFSAMHPALQKRTVPLLLKYLYNGETIPAIYNASLVNQVVRQLNGVHGSAAVHLPKGWRLERTYGRSIFLRNGPAERGSHPVSFPENQWIRWGAFRLRWCRASEAAADELAAVSEWRYFRPAPEGFPAEIRVRQPGDRIRLKGMDTPKKLSRLFIDEKIGHSQRDELPVIIAEDGSVCAVPFVRYGGRFTSEEPDGEAYILMTDRQ
ncbi:tRNA lysidine(34) synthetase TilS [Sporosarcina trichiuri]|uniref:tRNA lysidine(34) synthetase TilS n=1 Tax=Sporosarcina trichiuri TaxID=3056445 RepID=UPI0025B5FBA6|nr:tRNA lysidine(34) synthetase TilS [Sporosarcina sp. 0.2-SM1T-5]WJY26715.1 tRNA lysidine(34) synthetase TilS [Sporosarcina sp. 0.2-SM1T-5]